MPRRLSDLRPVYVIGIGLHPYQDPSETPFVQLGLTAVRAALSDAAVSWRDVESVYTGSALSGVSASLPFLRYLGATGAPTVQVENASASGSSAFRLACLDVASGTSDIALAVGVDKPSPRPLAEDGLTRPADGLVPPVAQFALLADRYMRQHGVEATAIARIAVKNLAAAARNPNAQRRIAPSLEDVVGARPIAGMLTKWQCCPIGEGGAAVLVASEEAITRLGIDTSRAVQVRSSAARSEGSYPPDAVPEIELTRETAAQALADAGVSASELDVVELHDAFSIEEAVYIEAMGLCEAGTAPALIADGAFDIGGRCAVSPSGGLLGMGHPVGPTGIGQIAEITRQLRGEAGDRQQPGASIALAHMVGVGAVCVVHVLGA